MIGSRALSAATSLQLRHSTICHATLKGSILFEFGNKLDTIVNLTLCLV